MPKWRRKARAIDATKLTPNSRIPHAEAVHLIADRIIDDSERGDPHKPRATRDRVRKRIKYAIKIGDLPTLTTAGFVLKDLLLWASHAWPGKFDDLPKHASGVATVTSSTSVSVKGVSAPLPPSDITQCHKLIAELTATNAELKDELRKAKLELAVEKPDARKWREFKRKSGQRGL